MWKLATCLAIVACGHSRSESIDAAAVAVDVAAGEQDSTVYQDGAAPERASAIASAAEMVCAATPAAMKCWGRNSGAMGNGSNADAHSAVAVTGVTSAISTSVGSGNACALTAIGGVKCWGAAPGSVGSTSATIAATPVDVAGLATGVVAIASGDGFSCALTATGAVMCWGFNNLGQLGNGTTDFASTPVAVTGLTSGVSAIALAAARSCALLDTGAVECWGQGYAHAPIAVLDASYDLVTLSIGEDHACGVTATGGAKCWGGDYYGQLGNRASGSTSSYGVVDVVGLSSGVTMISAGTTDTCAVVDGGVKCWGSNNDEQLGIELGASGTLLSSVPVDVTNLAAGVVAVAAGYDSTCALMSVGTVKCWGHNTFGQLGDQSTTQTYDPADVVGIP